MTPSVEAARPTARRPMIVGSSRRPISRELAPVIIVLLCGLTVSAPTVTYDFVLFDDDYLVYRNPLIRDLGNIPRFFDPTTDRSWMGSEYLPITTLSFALDHALYGDNAHGFHATNVALYSLCCCLLYLVLRGFTSNVWAAAAGAILFAVHPLHTENFAWVAGRKSLLNGVFTLMSFLAYMRYRAQDDDRRWYCAALASYVLAFFSKYTAVSLPGALFAYDLLAHRERDSGDRRHRAPALRRASVSVLPFLAVGGGLSVLAVTIGIEHDIVSPRSGALEASAINDPIILLHYLKLLFFPVDQCAFYLWPRRSTLTLPAVLGYVVAGGLAGGAWRLRRTAPCLTFAVAWFFALLVPLLNFLPKVPEMADRYLFLPSIAVSFATVWIWEKVGSRSEGRPRLASAGRIAFGAVVAVLGVVSLSRSTVWRDSYTLWTSTLEHPMASPVAYDQLGLAHLTLAKNPPAAIATFKAGLAEMRRRGTETSHLSKKLGFHLTLAYLEADRLEQARESWSEVEHGATSQDPALRRMIAGWRQDLSRHYPALHSP